jgi:DeoR family fructose operon transcriptional repressor
LSVEALLPAERLRRILEFIGDRDAMRVAELSSLLSVSEVTIRRDLELLERKGLLERTRGGAISAHRIHREPRYADATLTYSREKAAIGALAAGLVQPRDTVFMTSGTTTQHVFRNLAAEQVTVVTNNIGIALDAEVAPEGVEVLLLGGQYRARSRSLVGTLTSEFLHKFIASKAFIGVDGLSTSHGLTAPSNDEGDVARLMIEQTRGDVIVVADHSKIGQVADRVIADISKVDYLVVDSGISPEHHKRLTEKGIQVLVASIEEHPTETRGSPTRATENLVR